MTKITTLSARIAALEATAAELPHLEAALQELQTRVEHARQASTHLALLEMQFDGTLAENFRGFADLHKFDLQRVTRVTPNEDGSYNVTYALSESGAVRATVTVDREIATQVDVTADRVEITGGSEASGDLTTFEALRGDEPPAPEPELGWDDALVCSSDVDAARHDGLLSSIPVVASTEPQETADSDNQTAAGHGTLQSPDVSKIEPETNTSAEPVESLDTTDEEDEDEDEATALPARDQLRAWFQEQAEPGRWYRKTEITQALSHLNANTVIGHLPNMIKEGVIQVRRTGEKRASPVEYSVCLAQDAPTDESEPATPAVPAVPPGRSVVMPGTGTIAERMRTFFRTNPGEWTHQELTAILAASEHSVSNVLTDLVNLGRITRVRPGVYTGLAVEPVRPTLDLPPIPNGLRQEERDVFDLVRRASGGLTEKQLASRLNWTYSRTQGVLGRMVGTLLCRAPEGRYVIDGQSSSAAD